MFRLDRFFKYIWRRFLSGLLWWVVPGVLFVLAVLISPLWNVWIPILWDRVRAAWLVALGLLILLWAVRRIAVWWLATDFVQDLYDVPSRAEAGKFLNYSMSGTRFGFGPYRIIKEGKDAFGQEVAKQIGGPGGLVIYNDSAVVLEQAGKLTRVIRGPGFPDTIQPFEKVWDVVDLRPQRWAIPIEGRTSDGIPVTFTAEITFKIGETADAIFKAATDTWVRDAWRTDADRLMTWSKRVVIGWTEGTGRSLLARHTMDQVVKLEYREKIRAALEDTIKASADKAGIEIRSVTFGDIKLDGRVLDQWLDVWRTERKSELSKALREGHVKRLRTVTGAKAQVRQELFNKVVDKFGELGKQGDTAIILSFIEVLRQVSMASSLYLPNVFGTMDTIQARLETKSVASGQESDADREGAYGQGTLRQISAPADKPAKRS